MALTPGARLGSYEVAALIGVGGMGEVYRARDVKLKRDVALKVLPDVFARDHDRMSRFQREAELLASLNHPNIATIHGVEDNALVMELVEGETLKGPLPVTEALRAARQIADALEYAHDRGVIHRDLKPANVKITADGAVKLLDFGLAKAIEDPVAAADMSHSPTLTMNATRSGVILGTAAYMSPEQAHGRPADRRSDIWSFGTVLYELLTGQPTFSGESVSDTLASVLKLDPDLHALPSDTPAAIRTLLRRCLTRDRKLRLQAIGEARIVIDDVLGGKADEQAAPPEATRSNIRHARFAWAAAAALALMLGFATWRVFQSPDVPPRRIARLLADAPVADVQGAIALSRDGSMVAFVGGPTQRIHLRAIDQFEAKSLNGTEGASSVSFSPDGRWIGFLESTGGERRLKKAAIDGSPVQTLGVVKSIGPSPIATWGRDDNILATNGGALARIKSSGGTLETLAADGMQKELTYRSLQLLPEGRHVLASIQDPDGNHIIALNVRTGEKTTLLQRGGDAQFVPTASSATRGHIVYYDRRVETLMAVAFDAGRVAIAGEPVPVLEGVQSARIGPFGLFAISESGMLAYVARPGGSGGGVPLVWVDRNGTEEPVKVPSRNYRSLRLSPDGQRVAVSIDDEGETMWVVDLTRGSFLQLAKEASGGNAVWTPDGSRLFYERRPPAAAIMTVPADGSGSPSVVMTWKDGPVAPSAVSPDGKLLFGYGAGRTLSIPVSRAVQGSSTPDVASELAGRTAASLSPDGRWMAYRTVVGGRPEIYVAAFPGPGATYPISTEGSSGLARWSPTGRELYYMNGDRFMAVQVDANPAFRAGVPKQLFEGYVSTLGWDVDPNGKRFLMVKRPAPTAISVVMNWVDELRRRVPLPASWP